MTKTQNIKSAIEFINLALDKLTGCKNQPLLEFLKCANCALHNALDDSEGATQKEISVSETALYDLFQSTYPEMLLLLHERFDCFTKKDITAFYNGVTYYDFESFISGEHFEAEWHDFLELSGQTEDKISEIDLESFMSVIQETNPRGYNAVYHFEDGPGKGLIFCWCINK